MKEVIGKTKPYVKPEKEDLLPNGTIVVVSNDEDMIERKIHNSLPSEVYAHRYFIEGWSYVCEKRDFIKIVTPQPLEVKDNG